MGWKGSDREGPSTGKGRNPTGNKRPPPAADRILPILQLKPELIGGKWLGVDHLRRRVSDWQIRTHNFRKIGTL